MHARAFLRLLTRSLGAIAICAMIATMAACGSSSPALKHVVRTPIADGQSIGKIERSAGGTAVVTSVRSLLSLTCRDGILTLRTNLEILTGKMDCAQMIAQAIADRFLGQAVVATYTGGNLQIENPNAGTIILPKVTDLLAASTDVTP